MLSVETNETKKGLGIHARRALAYIVLVIMSFLCLFWFYILFVNATRSKGELTQGFTLLPSTHSKYKPVKKLEQSGARNASNLVWHVQQSDHRCLLSSALYIFLNHDRICDPCI